MHITKRIQQYYYITLETACGRFKDYRLLDIHKKTLTQIIRIPINFSHYQRHRVTR